MKRFKPPMNGSYTGMNRRQFLTGCAACAGAALTMTSPQWLQAASVKNKTRIHIIYSLHGEKQEVPDWPNIGFDFGPTMQRITSTLKKSCKDFEFLVSLAQGPEQAQKILDEDKTNHVDGYLVYQMNCWNRVVQTIATANKPVLYADFQFGGSGGFLVYTARFLREGAANVAYVASSDINDLIEAVKRFAVVKKGGSNADFVAAVANLRIKRTPKVGRLECHSDEVQYLAIDDCLSRLQEAKILAFRNQEGGDEHNILGIKIVYVPFSELNDAWRAADKDQAKAIADQWQSSANRVIDVSRETLENCAAMYLAEKAVMEKYGANGITINCLGGFYGGHIHAYPCLGFYELNNHGFIGACECDVRSAATMMVFTTLTQGRPGYISDPVIDTSKRQIIYAHCVASNRVFGPQGPANPFEIMTHSEDRQGASVRSIMPVGYMTTSLELDQKRKQILMHRAKAVANDADDRACRTKLCAEPVGDIEKLFREWDNWGWHRVTFYGDLKEPVYAMADKIGWEVVEEA